MTANQYQKKVSCREAIRMLIKDMQPEMDLSTDHPRDIHGLESSRFF
jgi:hypothetical protein